MPRNVPAGVLVHLEGEASMIIILLKVTPLVGSVIAVTNHTENITVSGVVYLARPGMIVSHTVANSDMSVDNTQVVGFFVTGVVTVADVFNGRFDGATYELAFGAVNETTRCIYDFGTIGEIAIVDNLFTAELRSELSKLNRPVGRILAATCDATLGDSRCLFVHTGDHVVSGSISTVTDAITFTATISATLAVTGWFNDGVLTWTGGDNSGYKSVVGEYSRVGSTGTFVLLLPPGQTLDVGDTFSVKSGCDKEFDTCALKFANRVNFKGFPHLLGDDVYSPMDTYL